MNENQLNTYCKLRQQEGGIDTYFRKFEKGVWVFQYKDGLCIGQIFLETDNFEAIYGAPAIRVGDANSIQSL